MSGPPIRQNAARAANKAERGAGRTHGVEESLLNKNPPQRAVWSVRRPVFERFEPQQHRIHLVPQVGDFF